MLWEVRCFIIVIYSSYLPMQIMPYPCLLSTITSILCIIQNEAYHLILVVKQSVGRGSRHVKTIPVIVFILALPCLFVSAHSFSLEALDNQKAEFIDWGLVGDWKHPYITSTPGFIQNELMIFQQLYDKVGLPLLYL